MPIMEISIVPLGTKTASLSKYIAACEKVLAGEKKIKTQLTAMGTIIEADSVRKLLSLAEKMHKKALALGLKRVLTTIKIDERVDKKSTIESKIDSVRKKLTI